MDFAKWDRIFMTNSQCLELLDLVDIKELNDENHPMRNYDMYPLHRFVLSCPNTFNSSSQPDRKKLINKKELSDEDIRSITEDLYMIKYRNAIFHHCYTLAGDHLEIRTLVEMNGVVEEAFVLTIDAVHLTLRKATGKASEMVTTKIHNRFLKYWEWLLLCFMLINTYILSDPGKTTEVEIKEVPIKKLPDGMQRNRPPRKGPNKVRLVRSYRLKKNWKTAVKKRVQQIKCEAWGVRGHFRHYKDGRVVFVHPYVKGKKRDEYKGKIYELFPKSEIKMEG